MFGVMNLLLRIVNHYFDFSIIEGTQLEHVAKNEMLKRKKEREASHENMTMYDVQKTFFFVDDLSRIMQLHSNLHMHSKNLFTRFSYKVYYLFEVNLVLTSKVKKALFKTLVLNEKSSVSRFWMFPLKV